MNQAGKDPEHQAGANPDATAVTSGAARPKLRRS